MKTVWSKMKNEHYELFYLTGSFAVQNFTEAYVDNSTFCSENSVQNSKSEENSSIRLRNKIENVLPGDSVRYRDPKPPIGRFFPCDYFRDYFSDSHGN